MRASILILGGGVGGTTVATGLRRQLSSEHGITLVERAERLFLGASLLRVIVGERRPEEIVRPVAGLSRSGVEIVNADVERIDPGRLRVVAGGRELEADHLVIALGAELDASSIPGLTQAGHSFYTLEGAVALRDALARLEGGRLVFLTAAPAYKCPAAPYETVMLAEALLRRRGVRAATTIELHAAEPAPMGVAGPAVSAAVRDLLAARGITYHPGRQVTRVDVGARRLLFADGAEAGYDLLAYVAPHRAPRTVREAGLVGEAGWIPVDRATLRTRFDHVWALGDVTGIPLSMGKPLPKAATFAEGEAEVVARGIAAEVTGGAPAAAFTGAGECWVEVGDGLTAHGHGDFFGEPTPRVALEPPGEEAHRAKEAWERDWLQRWS